MSLAVWLSLLAASVVISLTPGAGAINTMSNAIAHGWRRAVWGVIGQQLALILHVAIVAAGVGLLIARSPVLFDIIRYAGAGSISSTPRRSCSFSLSCRSSSASTSRRCLSTSR